VARSMKRKERYIARVDELKITREGDYAFIEYKEEGVPTTRLQIGPEIAGMSDEQIVELHNECLRAQAKRAAEYKHVAVEVPLGSAQIEYRARSDQWVPRGSVLRCLIRDEGLQLVVDVDEQELQLEQFGKLLTTYAGWGMRIEFVPEDEVHRRPVLEVREPELKT
jgi:hypothetical protein